MSESATPTRIQRRRSRGWKMPENTACVDRSTPFGSPFPIIKGTSASMGVTTPIWQVGTWQGPGMWFVGTKEEAIALSVKAFRAWIAQPQQRALREKGRITLRGRDLACWCPLPKDGEPDLCHAAVLLEIANS